MKQALRITALLIALAGFGTWLGFGLNLGWTKTSLTVMQTDPVTEIRYPTYQAGFYPGVDFLAVCVLTAAGLFGVSFTVRRKQRAF